MYNFRLSYTDNYIMIANRLLVDLEGSGPEIGLMKSCRQFIETDYFQLDLATYEVLGELRE